MRILLNTATNITSGSLLLSNCLVEYFLRNALSQRFLDTKREALSYISAETAWS